MAQGTNMINERIKSNGAKHQKKTKKSRFRQIQSKLGKFTRNYNYICLSQRANQIAPLYNFCRRADCWMVEVENLCSWPTFWAEFEYLIRLFGTGRISDKYVARTNVCGVWWIRSANEIPVNQTKSWIRVSNQIVRYWSDLGLTN